MLKSQCYKCLTDLYKLHVVVFLHRYACLYESFTRR